MKHHRTLPFLGALLGATAVIAGAFAAHALQDKLEPKALAAFQTAARYQLIHAVVLLLPLLTSSRLTRIAGGFFVVGNVLFAGSIYGLTLLELKWLGPVTPLGGLCLILGWLLLAVGIFQGKQAMRTK